MFRLEARMFRSHRDVQQQAGANSPQAVGKAPEGDGPSNAGSPAASTEQTSPFQVFAYDDFEFQFQIALGCTFERAADIGECLAVASRITDYDYDSWVSEWETIGDHVRDIAHQSEAGGHTVSAREAWLRAASYYARAYAFVDGTSAPTRLVPMWEKHRAAADAFFVLLNPPAVKVEIPYEGTTLPGYAITVDDSGAQRPWLILNNGSDGTVTDMWVQGGAAAIRRGYNVLIFDGPGEGAALYQQNLYFRSDWEKVITPVVDWLVSRNDVDPSRIALLGVSQGGYWVARAVAFEHRIAAAIVDPGVMDVSTVFTSQLPPELLQALQVLEGDALEQVKKELDEGVAEGVAHDPRFAFTLTSRLRPYGMASFSDVVMAVQDYNLSEVVSQITCPVLIADPEGEQFWAGQSKQLNEALTGSSKLVPFSAAQGADSHCEPKANALRSQVFFDWLDETLAKSHS
jgi:hypothetical protein